MLFFRLSDMDSDPEEQTEKACYNTDQCIFEEDEQQDPDLQDKMVQARLFILLTINYGLVL